MQNINQVLLVNMKLPAAKVLFFQISHASFEQRIDWLERDILVQFS